MTNNEKFRSTFSHLHAAPDPLKMVMNANRKHISITLSRNVVVVALVACLIFAFGITAYASGIFYHLFGWGRNFELAFDSDKDGYTNSEAKVSENITEPIQFKNGRMIFVVNGQYLDITDKVSKSNAFTYKYVDADGYTHYWIVGLNGDDIKSYGFSEYYKSPYGEDLGGYGVRADADGELTDPEWLTDGLAKLGIAEPEK